MDDKGKSGQPAGNGRSWKRQFLLGNMKDRKHIATFLHTHTKSLFAGFLIVAILVLLFGIFSQFQAPATNEVPSGETSINYSAFLQQVNTNNVLAISIEGNSVNALLQKPLSGQPASHETAAQRSAEITAWMHNAGSFDPGWDTSTPAVAADRQVYTLLPASGSS
ncbi:MAG: ATP-dependent metallopeptidase FtsH/Yme1/Tma family protein [Ktedonobacteraceae bacterium]